MADRFIEQQNFFETTLTKDILTADETVIYLDILPQETEGYLVISQDDQNKREIIYYTELGATYVVCPASGGRGVGGTTAQTHDTGELVVMDNVSEHHNPIVRCLADYRSKAGITFTADTDNISVSAGTVVINNSVCINSSSESLTDIGSSGTNKDGTVSSGGIRYIYAQDDGDGTFSLYVSNNTSEVGKRRLGFAKFQLSTTDKIRYTTNDDEYSYLARGMIFDWYGPSNDIPANCVLCDGTNGTPDCRDKMSIALGTTYSTLAATGGAATTSISHSHTVSSHSHQVLNHGHGFYAEAPGTSGVGDHSHTYSGTTGYEGGTSQPEGTGAKQCAEEGHRHDFSGTTSGSGAHSHTVNNHGHGFYAEAPMTNNSAPGTSDATVTSVTTISPYIVLAKIMKS